MDEILIGHTSPENALHVRTYGRHGNLSRWWLEYRPGALTRGPRGAWGGYRLMQQVKQRGAGTGWGKARPKSPTAPLAVMVRRSDGTIGVEALTGETYARRGRLTVFVKCYGAGLQGDTEQAVIRAMREALDVHPASKRAPKLLSLAALLKEGTT